MMVNTSSVCVINTTRLIPWLRKMGFWNELPNSVMGTAISKAIHINGGWDKSKKQVPSIWAILGLLHLCNKFGNPVNGWEDFLPNENYKSFMIHLFSLLNEWIS
jgi:hypothetical protein